MARRMFSHIQHHKDMYQPPQGHSSLLAIPKAPMELLESAGGYAAQFVPGFSVRRERVECKVGHTVAMSM